MGERKYAVCDREMGVRDELGLMVTKYGADGLAFGVWFRQRDRRRPPTPKVAPPSDALGEREGPTAGSGAVAIGVNCRGSAPLDAEGWAAPGRRV